jgi:hypothetical protein
MFFRFDTAAGFFGHPHRRKKIRKASSSSAFRKVPLGFMKFYKHLVTGAGKSREICPEHKALCPNCYLWNEM